MTNTEASNLSVPNHEVNTLRQTADKDQAACTDSPTCDSRATGASSVTSIPSKTANVINYGDVVKLFTRSAYVESDGGFLGFIEQDKATSVRNTKTRNSQHILVVSPMDENTQDIFVEAEFIITPIRSDKTTRDGSPLLYKKPFLLTTSDGSGYSLNNKTPGFEQLLSLQPMHVKGEMHMIIVKEGYSSETSVHHGDLNVTLTVIDSNRIRAKYNKPLAHFTIPKSSALGGHVCCGSSKPGTLLNFKVVKCHGKRETCRYLKDPIQCSESDVSDTTNRKIDESTKAERVDEETAQVESSPAKNVITSTTTAAPVEEDELASVNDLPNSTLTISSVSENANAKILPAVQPIGAPSKLQIEPVCGKSESKEITSEEVLPKSTLSTVSLNDEDTKKSKLTRNIIPRKSDVPPVIVTAFALPDSEHVDEQHKTLQEMDEFGLETANCLGEIEMPNCVGENRCSIM
uniref:Uncharacterized protein AlNc14C11G1353 n=1 Tax=Albugo laibachii Nc14 TaxID=890382 RepID=F0W2X4_9STRA|nr:conserved hypothetical protein [Albugo laibachii Nc14]|eukprot:CCA15411.1 conserved hypothetical protein [Albugo laibachii Nc14]